MMKLTRYTIHTLLITLMIMLVSCSDFLYVEPDEQISIGEQFSTKEMLLQTVNGAYKDLEDFVRSNLFVYPDLQGGNVTFLPNSSSNTITVPSSYEYSYGFDDLAEESDYEAQYEEAYDIINQTNLIIENLYESPDTEDEVRQQIKAEMLAMRAYVHFVVSQMYSHNMQYSTDGSHLGIVYNRSTIQAGVDFPARETKLVTYQYLKADMEEAISLFTSNQVFDYGPSYSYFNTESTQALLARMALDNADWSTAYGYADAVIGSTSATLMTIDDYEAQWRDSMAVSETLLEFSVPVSSEGDVGGSIGSTFYGYAHDQDDGSLTYITQGEVASEDVVDLYESGDVRLSIYDVFNIETLINGLDIYMPYYFVGKFQDDHGTTIMRLSELFLIRAEATYRSGGSTADVLSNLNTIQENRGATLTQGSDDLLEAIFTERRKELAFEGHMLYDLVRFQKSVERTQGCVGSVCMMNYPSEKFILPIPESSTELNENMIQNATY